MVFASVMGDRARCPRCGQPSSRVHGRYQRLLADGAAGGRPLLIALSVRRFRCAAPSCTKVTFTGLLRSGLAHSLVIDDRAARRVLALHTR